MKIKELISALERFAPLPLQESYDNAGLQVGLTEVEASGALLCLDVTERVIDEAVKEGFNLVISHHPLLFQGLKTVSDQNMVQRCVRKAIQNNITIYSAHTNLDNAEGGVNYKIAQKLNLQHIDFLQPRTFQHGDRTIRYGSGVIGKLLQPTDALEFLHQVKSCFSVSCLMHNTLLDRKIAKVALCGGSGSFMLKESIAAGADAFLTGEMSYHDYFDHDNTIQIGILGHYQSEQYTQEIIYSIIRDTCGKLPLKLATSGVNPINYL